MSRLVLTVVLAPVQVTAHDLSDEYGPFLGPSIHVLTEIDHLTALVGIGLLAGTYRKRSRAAALAVFSIALVTGLTVPLLLPVTDDFEALDTTLSPASLIVTGVLIALGRNLPVAMLAFVALAVGAVHGIANGLAIMDSTHTIISMAGVFGTATVLAASGATASTCLRGPRGQVAVRVAGSWLAAIGIMVLGLALCP